MTQHDPYVDDLDAYIASYSSEEREELGAAELADDLAIRFHRVRVSPEVSQPVVAERVGVAPCSDNDALTVGQPADTLSRCEGAILR